MERKDYSTEAGRGDYAADATNHRRISWAAIFAGTLAALAVQLLLTLLGISIGAWAANPSAGADGMEGIGMGAGIWALASFIISLYCGGWIAGRLAGVGTRLDGLLEGFLVWSAVTALTLVLLSNAIGGVLGGAAGLAENVIRPVAERMDDPAAAMREAQARAQAVANDPQLRQNAQEVRQSSEAVANKAGTGSFWAFLSLLLGAITASFAGRAGRASGIRDTEMFHGTPARAGAR